MPTDPQIILRLCAEKVIKQEIGWTFRETPTSLSSTGLDCWLPKLFETRNETSERRLWNLPVVGMLVLLLGAKAWIVHVQPRGMGVSPLRTSPTGRALNGALPFFVPTRRGRTSRTWDTRYLLYAAVLRSSQDSAESVLWDLLWEFSFGGCKNLSGLPTTALR